MSDLRDACNQAMIDLGLMPPPESQAPHKIIDYDCPVRRMQRQPRFTCNLPSTWEQAQAHPLSVEVLLLRVDSEGARVDSEAARVDSEAAKVWCRKADRRECADVLSGAFECRLDTGMPGVADVVEEVVVRTGIEVSCVYRMQNEKTYLAHKYYERTTCTGDAHVVYHPTTRRKAREIAQTGLCPGMHVSTNVWETLDRAKPEHGSLLRTFIVGTCVRNEHADSSGTWMPVAHKDQIYPHYVVSVRTLGKRGPLRGIPRTLWDAETCTQRGQDLEEHMEFQVGDQVKVVKSASATIFCVGAEGVVKRIVKDNRRVHFCVRLHDADLRKRVEEAANHFKYPWLDDWTLLRCQWSYLKQCTE